MFLSFPFIPHLESLQIHSGWLQTNSPYLYQSQKLLVFHHRAPETMEALSLTWNFLHQISSGVWESGTNGLCAHVWMEPMNICRWVFMPDPLPVYLRGLQPTLSGSLSQDTIICTMCIMCHEIKRFRQPKQNSVLDAKVFVKILKAILGEREVCVLCRASN